MLSIDILIKGTESWKENRQVTWNKGIDQKYVT